MTELPTDDEMARRMSMPVAWSIQSLLGLLSRTPIVTCKSGKAILGPRKELVGPRGESHGLGVHGTHSEAPSMPSSPMS